MRGYEDASAACQAEIDKLKAQLVDSHQAFHVAVQEALQCAGRADRAEEILADQINTIHRGRERIAELEAKLVDETTLKDTLEEAINGDSRLIAAEAKLATAVGLLKELPLVSNRPCQCGCGEIEWWHGIGAEQFDKYHKRVIAFLKDKDQT